MEEIKALIEQWKKAAEDKFITNMIDFWSNEDRAFYHECCDKMKEIEQKLTAEYNVEVIPAFFDGDTQFKYNGEVIPW